MRRILLVLTAAMVMALMVVAMALPALAAPPQEGDFVGGDGIKCTRDSETQTDTCTGGGSGHTVGSQYGSGGGGSRTNSDYENITYSGGQGGGQDFDYQNGGAGTHCALNSEGTHECVGGGSPGV